MESQRSPSSQLLVLPSHGFLENTTVFLGFFPCFIGKARGRRGKCPKHCITEEWGMLTSICFCSFYIKLLWIYCGGRRMIDPGVIPIGLFSLIFSSFLSCFLSLCLFALLFGWFLQLHVPNHLLNFLFCSHVSKSSFCSLNSPFCVLIVSCLLFHKGNAFSYPWEY